MRHVISLVLAFVGFGLVSFVADVGRAQAPSEECSVSLLGVCDKKTPERDVAPRPPSPQPPSPQKEKDKDEDLGAVTRPSADVKPFLSPVTIHEWAGSSPLGDPVVGKSVEPNLYWDMPFALNVPFEQPYDGGNVRVYFILRERWDTPGAAPKKGHGWFGSKVNGLYAMDGKPLPEESVRYDDLKGAPLKLSPHSTTPVYYIPSSNYMWPERTDKHQPFTDEDGKLRYGSYLSMSPARPGWYVLWWQFANLSWPWLVRERESVEVTLVVDTMVSRGEGPGPERLEYLLGRGPKPSWGQFDPSSVRITTHELKVTFRKDGWSFSRVEVEPKSELQQKTLSATQPIVDEYFQSEMAVQQQVNAGGPSAALMVRTTMTKRDRDRQGRQRPKSPPTVEEMNWQVQFPQVVLDEDAADVIITAKREQKPEERVEFQNRPPWYEDWRPYARGGSELHGWLAPPISHEAFTGILRERGLADNEWFQKLWFEEAAREPKQGEPTRFRYYHGGLTSMALSSEKMRKAFAEGKTEEPILEATVGPWVVRAYYRRFKDLDALAAGGGPQLPGVKVVKEIDPYWQWYYEHHKLLKKQRAEGYKREALTVGTLMSIIRRDVDLIDASIKRPKNEAGDDPLETPTDRALRNLVESVWEMLPEVFDKAVETSATADRNKGAKLGDLRGELAKYRKELDGLSKQAEDSYTEIIDDLDKAGIKWAGKHPKLIHWQEDFTHDRERVPLVFAQASGDRDALIDALAKLEPAALSADTRAMMGQIYLSEGDVVSAMTNFRSAQDIDPKNALAAEGLKIAEVAILRTALSKSQGTVKIARDNFERYMKGRGYRLNWTPKATEPSEIDSVWGLPGVKQIVALGTPWWVDLVKYPLRKVDWDSVLAVVGTGVTGAISAGVYNRPGHEADLLNAYEESMGKAFMGLHMMIYLRGKGHTLDEIVGRDKSDKNKIVFGGASTSKIKSWMPQKNMHGEDFTDQDFRNLALAIHEAARLDEVTALLTGNDLDLRIALEKQSYWSKRDIADTWWEWVGDISSVKNVAIFFLPYAVHTTAPRLSWGFWSAREAAFAARLQATGRAMSGTEALARMTGWSKALELMGKTGAGRQLTDLLIKYHTRMEQLEKTSRLGRLTWTAAHFMGTIIITSVAAHYAEKWDMPQLNLLVEGMLLFGSDTEMLVKFMKQNKLPVAKAAAAIKQEIVPQLVAAEKRVAEVRMTTQELLDHLDGTKAIRDLAAKEKAAKALAALPADATPDGKAIDDIVHILKTVEAEVDSGVKVGASDVAKKMQQELIEEGEELAKLKGQVENTERALEGAGADAPPVDKPAVGPPTRIARDAPANWAYGKKGYKRPPTPHPDSKSAMALQALEDGDNAGAIALLTAAKNDVGVGTAPPDFELPEEVLDELITVAKKAPRTNLPKFPPADKGDIMFPIPDEDVERILALPRRELNFGKGAVQGRKFEVNGGEYFVKEITREEIEKELGPAVIQSGLLSADGELRRMAEAELVKEVLYDAVGLRNGRPGVNVKMDIVDGKIEKVTLVFRGIKGDALNTLSPTELFKLRKQLSSFRPADLVLGDCDRKPANFMLHGDGRVASVDAGLADPAGRRLPSVKKAAPDDAVFMEGEYGLDHYYERAWNEGYRNIYLAETFLTYEASKDTIRQLEQVFLKNPARRAQFEADLVRRLKRVYPDLSAEDFAKRVAENMEAMTARAKRVDQVMQLLNERQGRKMPVKGSRAPFRFEDFFVASRQDQAALAAWRRAA